MRITEWLKILSAENGSDLYLSTGAPPCVKFQGELKPIAWDIMQPGEIRDIAYEIMDETQQAEFEQELEMNLTQKQQQQLRITRLANPQVPAHLRGRQELP